jgi:GTPase
LLEVIDASDPEHEEHVEATEEVLVDLELGDRPRLSVYNKLDRVPEDERAALGPRAIGVSAIAKDSLAPLLRAISEALPSTKARRAEAYGESDAPVSA